MVRAVLFDLDDTLVDSKQSIERAFNFVLPRYGMAKIGPGVLPTLAGVPISDCYARLGAGTAQIPAMVKEHLQFLSEHSDLVKRYPDAQYVLSWLARHDTRVGLVTSRPRLSAMQVLSSTKIDSLINVLVADGDASEGKPSAAPFLLCAKKIQCAPRECMVVGDGVPDLIAGTRAGMTVVWAMYGMGAHAASPVNPAHRIQRLKDVLNLL